MISPEPSCAEHRDGLDWKDVFVDPFAEELADAIDSALPAWVERCVALRAGPAGAASSPQLAEAAVRAGQAAIADIGPKIRALLDADIDAQWTTPLALLRQAVVYPTDVLLEAGIPEVQRDRFSVDRFSRDIYGLTPAKFADVDESLADPGVAWGASKAMAHMRRHRS